MADPTYALGVQPDWYLVDNEGRPTAGFLYTYSSLNPTEYKPVYSDASNNFPYPQPVPFAANGTAGPLYFEFDSDTPDDLYYLVFKDADNNLLFDINNYEGQSGGGGGSVTTNINLKNYVANNVFEYNVGITASPVTNGTVLCPGAHNNFIDPDIRYITDGTPGTDHIEFEEFPFGSSELPLDVTPQYFMTYNCTVAGSGGNRQYVQFPIQPKVTTLQDQQITITFWARKVSGSDQISFFIRQFFGTQTASVTPHDDVFTLVSASTNLTTDWTQYVLSTTIPTVAGFTISPTGDDAVYLTCQFPHNLITEINMTKPCMYLGDSAPVSDFSSFQQIEAFIETPRTGDTRTGMSYASYVPGGWTRLTDGTIGSALSTSGMTVNRNNADTWFLYSYIWNSTSNTDCPIYLSDGTPSTRGANAAADFGNNKFIALPPGTGRVISNISGGHVIASVAGVDEAKIALNETPNHTHNAPAGSNNFVLDTPNNNVYTGGGGLGHGSSVTGGVTSIGAQTALSRIQPTVYIPTIIKL